MRNHFHWNLLRLQHLTKLQITKFVESALSIVAKCQSIVGSLIDSDPSRSFTEKKKILKL